MNEWIDVRERLPESGHVVLYYSPDLVRIGYLFNGIWYKYHSEMANDPPVFTEVTHWAELPEPPKD